VSHRLTRCEARGYFPRVRPTGRISIGGFFLLIGVIAGGYWCVLFLPLYIDHFEISDAISAAFNAYGIVSGPTLRTDLESKLREVKFATHKEFDMTGNEVDKPGLAVTEINPMIEADEVNKILTVSYRYERVVRLIPTDKIRVIHFLAKKKGKFPH